MDHCCETKTDELAILRDRQGRVLKIVLAINALMLLAAAGVALTGTAWPDILIGLTIAGVFLSSAWGVDPAVPGGTAFRHH